MRRDRLRRETARPWCCSTAAPPRPACSLPIRPLRTSSTAVWNCAVAALLRADLHDAARLLDDLAEDLAFVDRQRQRLLGVDVLAGLAGGDVDGRVPMVGRAVDDHVDVVAVEQLAVVAGRRRPCRRSVALACSACCRSTSQTATTSPNRAACCMIARCRARRRRCAPMCGRSFFDLGSRPGPRGLVNQ